MPHTKNPEKPIFDRLRHALHAHAERARTKSDVGFGFRVPENLRVPKISVKTRAKSPKTPKNRKKIQISRHNFSKILATPEFIILCTSTTPELSRKKRSPPEVE